MAAGGVADGCGDDDEGNGDLRETLYSLGDFVELDFVEYKAKDVEVE